MSGNTLPLSRATLRRLLGGLVLILSPALAQAEFLNLPPQGEDLVGRLRYVKAQQSDTLIDIAHDHSVGQDEIVMANPTVSRWLPGEGTKVLIPDLFVLPDAPRTGIVVNIPEMRLYFFPPGDGKNPPTQVITYPISVGRMDWKSPMGITKIAEKIKDPTWTPPESIKKEHALDGDFLPDVVPAGPNNPLGQFAMRLAVKGSYLIHGTGLDKADGIGMMVTHGCMRMYPEDIAQLYPQVSKGAQVNLVYQSVKVGWHGNALYIEVSQPLDEDHLGYDKLLAQAMPLIQKKAAERPGFMLNREALDQALRKPNGIPQIISADVTQAEGIPLGPRIAAPAPTPAEPAPAPAMPATNSSIATTPSAPRPQAIAPALAKPTQAPTVVNPSPAPIVNRPMRPLPAPIQAAPSVTTRPTQPAPIARPPAQTAPIAKPLAQPAPVASPAPVQRIPAPVQNLPKAQPATSAAPPARHPSNRTEEQLLPPIY